MLKSEAEAAIRQLVHVWRGGKGVPTTVEDHPSFSEFKSWAQQQGYSRYFTFSARAGADYVAEMWFDEELKQTWRR